MDQTKPDLTLSGGREVVIDLYQITISEYRGLFDKAQPDADGDAVIGRACGMTLAEVQALPYPDYRKLAKAFFEKARDVLADPN